MRVFVAGASGAIGRPLVRQLVAAGHEVTGMTRREESAEQIRRRGAKAAVCDVFDVPALERAVRDAEPDAVIHELTALPPRISPKREYLGATNRLRSEGTRNLIAAARAAGARRVIAKSVAFLYAPEGDRVKDEGAPLLSDAPGSFGEAVDALADLERQVTGLDEMEGIVLRYGWFYGPGTYLAHDGYQTEDVLKRRFPIVGDGDGVFSFIHVEDAASATVAALEQAPPGVYNVVDDDPVPQREWLPFLAEVLGAKPPRHAPVWLAKAVAGAAVAANAAGLRGASNAKLRELGWEPRYASWRQGFREALG